MAREFTVRSALELPAFRGTPYSVVAGSEALDRPVRWVHTGEIPDLYRFLSGGEMLLTAGLGMGATAEQQQLFVERIAEAGAAVLVIELSGRMFSTMPEVVVDTARRLNLPLIALDGEIPFAEVSAQVHEMLVESRVADLVADEAAGQAFMNLLLAGKDYPAVVRELARRAVRPVVLEDVSHRILAYAGATPAADELTADWARHSRAVHERNPHAEPDPARQESTGVACVRRPIVLRGESWGWLHLLHGGGTVPTRADVSALERAAATVAVTLLGERESGARAAKREAALLNRLLLGDISGEDFLTRALALGQDMRENDLMVAVIGQQRGRSADRDLKTLLHAAGLPAIVGDLGDFELAVVGVARRPDAGGELVGLLHRAGVWGGLSRVVGAAGLAAALRQGRSAASAAAAGAERGLIHFDDLGVLRLLVSLAEGPELARYVEDELGELLRHDTTSSHPLLPTLRAFLECGGNKTRATDLLFVQRRTLYYRLDRIGRLLGKDLEDVSVQQRLLMALQGHDLLSRPLRGEVSRSP
ncbi:PucR family transcriptional regulator [Pseudonocardia alni]|uniref:PucR family transcriptional regulator n=1 Tax=Pseudonocardia alni TaxID=33907 RepID=UPI0033CC5116